MVLAAPNMNVKHGHHDHRMKHVRTPFLKSFIFHALVFLISFIGVPFIAKKPPLISKPINIEIVEIADESQTINLAPPQKEEPEAEPEIKVEKLEEKKTAPQMTSDAPPDLTKRKKTDFKKEIIPESLIKVTPKTKPKPPKPKEPEKKEPEKTSPDVDDQSDLFSSLLKNLAPDEEDVKPNEGQKEDVPKAASQLSAVGEQMTMSELDAFKQQLAPCWNVQSGSKYAENLLVEVRVIFNPDMTVQGANLTDQIRYGLDPHYRAAADAALRALRNPACQPFRLPRDKYEQWKVMTIRFDPREML